jgi:hypothetical protein
MNLRETGCEVVDWLQLLEDRFRWRTSVNTVVNRCVLQMKGLTTTLSTVQGRLLENMLGTPEEPRCHAVVA